MAHDPSRTRTARSRASARQDDHRDRRRPPPRLAVGPQGSAAGGPDRELSRRGAGSSCCRASRSARRRAENTPRTPSPRKTSGGRSASPFRPTIRPPVAVLTVFDDGKTDGEVIRIRDYRFVIGRSEGDLRIPLDGRMSSRHVEITHQVVGGLHRWVVTDLQSTHGLFVRVSKTALADKAEFLVGNGRYRFDAPQARRGRDGRLRRERAGPRLDPGLGRRAQPVPAAGPDRAARQGDRQPHPAGQARILDRLRPDLPDLPPRRPVLRAAARPALSRPQGGWHAEHNKTQNGLWLRMSQITVESMVQFQIGEQRFRLKVSELRFIRGFRHR